MGDAATVVAPASSIAKGHGVPQPQRFWALVANAVGLTLMFTAGPATAGGLTPIGAWLTSDRTGVIDFAACGSVLCGRIVGIVMDHPNEPTPRDHTGHSECGLPIINDAAETEAGVWQGHITDPRNGDVYRARLWLDEQGRLHLRGYILIPLLGQTQIWTRYRSPLPVDCRLTATAVGGATSNSR
jgi:uncharacterized protein (DUF2147 family)